MEKFNLSTANKLSREEMKNVVGGEMSTCWEQDSSGNVTLQQWPGDPLDALDTCTAFGEMDGYTCLGCAEVLG